MLIYRSGRDIYPLTLLLLSIITLIIARYEKEEIKLDPIAVKQQVNAMIEGLVTEATQDKRLQQEMREEIYFGIRDGVLSLNQLNIRYDSIYNDFDYGFEGDMGADRATVRTEMALKGKNMISNIPYHPLNHPVF